MADSDFWKKMCEIDNLIMQHWSAVMRHIFLETIATLEFLGVFGFAGIFLFSVFVMMGNIICQGLVPFPPWVTPRLGFSLGHSAKNAFAWVGNYHWAQGSAIPQLVPSLPRKVKGHQVHQRLLWEIVQKASLLCTGFTHTLVKKPVRCFNYKTQPKITSLIPRQTV